MRLTDLEMVEQAGHIIRHVGHAEFVVWHNGLTGAPIVQDYDMEIL